MGTKIKMVAVSRSMLRFTGGNSIKLSVRAARRCLTQSGTDPLDIGMLINTGIYRHKNIGEPSIASVIQRKVVAAALPHGRSENTFSFDLSNGSCGLLTGMEIVDGLISTGEISSGIIVTGDSEPYHGQSEGFNFEPAGAAVILSGSKDAGGLDRFRTYSFNDHISEFTASTSYSSARWNRRGKNILNINQKTAYLSHCVDCASDSLIKFLNESGMLPGDIDLFITSQSPSGLVQGIIDRIGEADKFVDPGRPGREIHTAGIAFALKKVWDNDRFKTSRNVVFLVVGSGITVSIALYRNYF